MNTTIMEMSDRISPILVKELRQGLRAKSFLILFLLIQAGMTFILLSSIASYALDGHANEEASIHFFWAGLWFTLLLLMPLLGSGAIDSERKENCLEILQLTHLQSLRIILGKWVSLCSQICLVVISILPYMAIRYFFGGVDLALEVGLIVLLSMLSLLMAGVTVSLSAVPLKWIRWVAGFGLGFGIVTLISPMIMLFGGMGPWGGVGWTDLLWMLLGLAVFAFPTLFILMHAAAQTYAPHAENHESVPRLLALFTLVAAIILAEYHRELWSVTLCVPAISLVTLQGLMSYCRLSQRGLRRFNRLGKVGNITRLFIAPGWPSGIFFSAGLHAILLVYFMLYSEAEGVAFTLALYATALVPVAAINLRTRFQARRMFTSWAAITLISIVVFICGGILASMTNGREEEILTFFTFLPIASLLLFAVDNDTTTLVIALMVVESLAALMFMGTHAINAIRMGWNRDTWWHTELD